MGKKKDFGVRTIDGTKLHMLLKKKNVTLTEASKALGYQGNTVGKFCRMNYISPQAMIGLEYKYQIYIDDILPDEEEKPVEEVTETNEVQSEPTPTVTFTAEELQEIIKSAVKDAVKDAVKEAIIESRNVFSSAMYDAINN